MTNKKNFNFDDIEYGQRYETVARQAIFGYEQLFPMIMGYLAADLGHNANVLVVGAGTGKELVTFGHHQPTWTITGVDPSEQMIGIARHKIQQNGLAERITLIQGYTHDLPLDAAFDGATLILVMQFLPDDGSKLALLQSIAQRLKSGAKLALMDLHGDPATDEFAQTLTAWKPYLTAMGMASEMISALLENALKSLFPISKARTWALLKEAGFTRVMRFYSAHLYGGWIAQYKPKR